MEAIQISKIIEKDGEIHLTDLPCKKGQKVELILLKFPVMGIREYPPDKLP